MHSILLSSEVQISNPFLKSNPSSQIKSLIQTQQNMYFNLAELDSHNLISCACGWINNLYLKADVSSTLFINPGLLYDAFLFSDPPIPPQLSSKLDISFAKINGLSWLNKSCFWLEKEAQA